MNNVLSNDESDYVMYQDTLWVDNGRFYFFKKSYKKEVGSYNFNSEEHDSAF